MQIALYADSPAEQQQITGDLKKCGLEYLRPVQVTLLSDYAEFCGALQRKRFDLLVIAMNGTFSLELMDAAARLASRTPVFWFSDRKLYRTGSARVGKAACAGRRAGAVV